MKVIVNNHWIFHVNLMGEQRTLNMSSKHFTWQSFNIIANGSPLCVCPLKSVNLDSIWFKVHLFDEDNDNDDDDDGGGSSGGAANIKHTTNKIRFCGAPFRCCCCFCSCWTYCFSIRCEQKLLNNKVCIIKPPKVYRTLYLIQKMILVSFEFIRTCFNKNSNWYKRNLLRVFWRRAAKYETPAVLKYVRHFYSSSFTQYVYILATK